jgi:hypothetical protein
MGKLISKTGKEPKQKLEKVESSSRQIPVEKSIACA